MSNAIERFDGAIIQSHSGSTSAIGLLRQAYAAIQDHIIAVADDPDALCQGLFALNDLKKQHQVVTDEVEQALIKALPDKVNYLDGVGRVDVTTDKSFTGWDKDRALKD